MGRKVKWFDTVQKILNTSEPDPHPAETEAKKTTKSRDKPRFKKLWQLAKSSNNASTSAAADVHHHQQPQPPPSPSQPDQPRRQEIVGEAQFLDACRAQGERVCPAEEVAAQAAVSEAVAGHADATPRARPARSKEDIAAARIQAACRGYLARRAQGERGMARLMSLVEGLAVKRQTEEALYCMQTMTRVQTQIYSRRLKTEEDKKALKNQVKIKQSFDKTNKIGEGWDHSHQTKEQMEAVLTMKQEAASRRQRALSYAFSHQWTNGNPSSALAAPAPMFMDPGNPNWGWTWTERWIAAAKPWENQTTAQSNGRATAKSAGGRPRVAALSIQTPGGRSFRPPNWPSLPSQSPSVSGRTTVPASPRSSTLHAASGLQRKSLQPDRCPRSSQQERAAAVSSPRCVVPASPRGGGSPLRASGSGGLQRATTMQSQPDRRPKSSQERAASSPRNAGTTATLLRTTSLRSERPRRLNLGGAAAAASASENASAPVTPSYMKPTTSVRAKARCASPLPSSSPKPDAPEKAPAPLQASSPSSAKKLLSLVVADKASTSSPCAAKAERAKRHSQPPSPTTQLT